MHDHASTTRCTAPVDQLEPEGVLVSWSRWYSPGFGLERLSGTPTRIAGHRAKLTIGAPLEWCARIGGQRSVIASIALPESSWTGMDACLRGPDIEAETRQVRQLLDSVQFGGRPQPAQAITLRPGRHSFLIPERGHVADSAGVRIAALDAGVVCVTCPG